MSVTALHPGALPTPEFPLVSTGTETRHLIPPPPLHSAHTVATAGYIQAVTRILKNGPLTASPGVYWTEDQVLHTADGTVIAHNLDELAQIVQALGLSDGVRVQWSAVNHAELAPRMLAKSRELGFID